MNTLDIIILLAILVPGIWAGLKGGFIDQLVSLAALLLGIWLGGIFAEQVGNFISSVWNTAPIVIKIVSYLLIFLIIYILLKVLGKLILKAVDKVFGKGIDKLLGMVLGIFKYAFLVGLLVILFNYVNGQFNLVSRESLSSSRVFVWMEDFSNTIFPYIKSLIWQKS